MKITHPDTDSRKPSCFTRLYSMFFSMRRMEEIFTWGSTGHLTQEKVGEALSNAFLMNRYGGHSSLSKRRVLWFLTRSIEELMIRLVGILFQMIPCVKQRRVPTGKKPFAIL